MSSSVRLRTWGVIARTIALATIAILPGGCPTPGGGSQETVSSAKAITAFSFVSPAVPGVIDDSAKTIAVTVAYSTGVTGLVATFTAAGSSVKVGSVAQVSGVTANDFSSPVIYTVIAADGSTVDYTVTVTVAPGFPGAALWASTVIAGTAPSSFISTVVDPGGSIYATGWINRTGSCTFGNGVTATGTCSDGNGGVLVKYSPAGAPQWARTLSGLFGSAVNSAAVDSSGSVYAAGCNSANACLVKYNSSGTILWDQYVYAVDGPGESSFSCAAVDSSGNVHASGWIHHTLTYDFGNGVTVVGQCSNGNSAVLVKYDSSGAALWARTVSAGTPGSDFGSTAVDAGGNVIAAGSLHGTGTYGFGGGVTGTGPGAVLVKYDSSGKSLWARTASPGSTFSNFNCAAVETGGSVYVAGVNSTAPTDFGNGVVAARSGAVLVKYDSNGSALWARTIGGGISAFYSTAVDSSGNAYAVGRIRGTGIYDLGDGVTAAATSTSDNLVVARYSSSGTPTWARTVSTGPWDSCFYSTAVDPAGYVYASGYVNGGTYTFGAGVMATPGFGSGTSYYGSAVLVKYLE